MIRFYEELATQAGLYDYLLHEYSRYFCNDESARLLFFIVAAAVDRITLPGCRMPYARKRSD